ncbi:MAG: D-alanyl-D-alanine carboxypeptidase/D-alanyl-D-alanine-endopeptidase [Betaproteobacteria bacterium]|nr:D-alanyl-D-alanine carboxypeptidase/D-alanyl-D-alanine-endopeptidase [Betaproteobacteria bacterium]MDE2621761.1 D-alanyl-D-alanine carboxypeptidase/D-alanyl-D-alanine-endopeptidase [Betaproteobacteria bacterium]
MRISRGKALRQMLLALGLGLMLALRGVLAEPGQPSLPAPVAGALAEAGIPPDAVSVVVQDLSTAHPLLSWNGDTPRAPASLMKLVTTYSALAAFGPAWTWETRVYGPAPRQGRVDGNLYVVGVGDPDLTLERWENLLRDLRIRGVRQIRGDVVLDASAFQPEPEDPGAFDHQAFRTYNTLPAALQVGFKAVTVTLTLDAEGRHVLTLPNFEFPGLEIVNRLQPAAGSCPADWKNGIERQVEDNGSKARITLRGRFPSGCGRKSMSFSVFSNESYIAQAFRTLWRQLGGSLSGRVRLGPAPSPELPMLAVTRSPPLADQLRLINKYSNNLMARTLLLDLGREEGRPASRAQGAAYIRQILAQRGLQFPELVVENGCGLSRQELISAGHLNALLIQASREPTQAEFVSSLAISGLDGTAERRFPDGEIEGRFHLKTGSLDDVSGMAGYGDTRSGHRVALVFVVNHAHAAAAKPAQEALLRWIGDSL